MRGAGIGCGTTVAKPVEADELEQRLGRRIAEETARLMRELDEIEDRLDLVERALRKPRGK
jgi:uncharacterized protein Yka (UPF0111/DUF47 family)